MAHNDIIDQGATFYRVVTVYSNSTNTVVVDLTDKTPRSTLMLPSGQHVQDFSCAIISAAGGTIAWSMPRSITATLEANRQYLFNIDLDDADGVTTDRALSGQITVRAGQVL